MNIYKIIRIFKSIISGGVNSQISINEFRLYGVKIGKGCNIYTNQIDLTHGYLISIGNNVTISHAEILAHDASTKSITGYSKVGKVTIGNNVFIGAKAIILPGVSIGDDCIIGAGAVVSRSIPSGSVVVGNPCKVISTYQSYVDKQKKLFDTTPHQDTYFKNKSELEKEQMNNYLAKNRFFFDI